MAPLTPIGSQKPYPHKPPHWGEAFNSGTWGTSLLILGGPSMQETAERKLSGVCQAGWRGREGEPQAHGVGRPWRGGERRSGSGRPSPQDPTAPCWL